MDNYEQFWQRHREIKQKAKTHLQMHVETLIEDHPHRNELIKRLNLLGNDESMQILISFLGNALKQQNRYLQSIKKTHKESYEELSDRMQKQHESFEMMLYNKGKKIQTITETLIKINKNQNVIYKQITKSIFKKMLDRFIGVFKKND